MTWEKEIEENLFSESIERTILGLHDLRMCLSDGYVWEIRPIGMEIFDSFKTVPIEAQEDFLYILNNHPLFSPPLSKEQIIKAMVKLIVRYGEKSIASNVALELKISDNNIDFIKIAMEEAFKQKQDISNEKSFVGIEWFTSCLLDGKKDVRAQTISTLLELKKLSYANRVINYVWPQMTEKERSLFNSIN
jgi:hypothetical protein